MALGDALEAILAGAEQGFGTYSALRERERERQEREAERNAERKFRQQQLNLQQRQIALSEENARRSEALAMQQAGFRLAEEDEPTGPMMFQPKDVEIKEYDFEPLVPGRPNIPAPDVERGRVSGTGAAAAPDQTYSAVQRALSQEPAVRTRRAEGPAVRVPGARDRGFDQVDIGEQSYLRVNPEILAQVERDRVRQQQLEDEQRQLQQQLESNIQLAQVQSGLTAGRDIAAEARAEAAAQAKIGQTIEALTPMLGPDLATQYAYGAANVGPVPIMEDLIKTLNTPNPITGETIPPLQQAMVLESAAKALDAEDIFESRIQALVDMDVEKGTTFESIAGVGTGPFARIERMRQQEAQRAMEAERVQAEVAQIQRALESGVYDGRQLTEREMEFLRTDLQRLTGNFGSLFPGFSGISGSGSILNIPR